jgi:sterol desaturase/sphingolipid hydroxylase (fatty acid hydroxylase superfamily)
MKWYWPVHAVHHADRHMNFTTLFRIHFLEGVAMKLAAILFLSWLYVPAEAYAIAAVLNMLVGQYIHLDIPISHGRIGDKIIASPQVHRWHHADDPEAFGKNLANFFSFLDVMFGTYHNPHPYKGRLGITPDPGQGLPANLMLPFTEWKRIIDKSRSDSEPLTETSTASA